MAKKSTKESLMKVIKILIGVVLILGGIFSYVFWWKDLLVLIKGGLGLLLILIGLIVVAASWSD